MNKMGHFKRMFLTLFGTLIAGAALYETPSAFAIEGLQVSVQCSNVVLTWPSIPYQNYIVQYRPTLDPSTPWVTLTNSYPADPTTNITVFVHSNIVLYPCNCGGGGGAPAAMSLSAGTVYASSGDASPAFYQPMVKPANGSGATVPLTLYPPGYDLSNFLIFDPTSAEWVSGAGYTVASPSPSTFTADDSTPDAPLPPGGSGGGGGSGSTNPPDMGFYQVVQEGVRIANASMALLTNGVLSNSVMVAFEAGNDTGILQEALVKVDGAPFTGGDGVFAAPWTLPFDTAYLENGTHTFQVEANWLNPDISDGNNFTFDVWSDPVTIDVANLISYPNWEPEIGTNSAYFLETVYTNANWQLDIYDSSNLLVDTLTGQATNGVIEAYWNLTDTNGVLRTNADTDPYFNATITVMPDAAPQAQANTPPKKQRPNNFPNQGSWVIAYQDSFQYLQNSNNYYSAIYQMGSIGAEFGGAYTYTPHAPGQPDNGQTWPLRYPSTNAPSLVTLPTMILDKNALRALLTNSMMRNFYYNGHGNPDSIAGMLGSAEIASYVRHFYRFVFLDACLASSGGLPKAFGIPYNKMMPLSYFQKAGLRPRTFLGYPITVSYYYQGHYQDSSGNSYVGQIPDSVPDFLTNFEFYWYYNYDVETAVGYAINDTPYIGNNWETGETLQIFGYGGLGVNDYNFGDAW